MRVFLVPLIIAAMLSLCPMAANANTNQAAADKIAAGLGSQFPGYDIAVKYQNGKVTLAGAVDSPATASKAVDFVQKMPGVTVSEVENGLQVSLKTNAAAPHAPVRQNATVQPIVAVPPVTPMPVRPNPMVAAPMPMPSRVHTHAVKPAGAVITHEQPQLAPLQQHYAVPHHECMHEPGLPYTHVAYGPEAYGPQGPLPGQYNQPNLPQHAWPSYASYPNYAEVCYPRQYSHKAWPYIGPFYPYPQVPTGWRKVSLEWHDGYWWLDFDEGAATGPFSPLFRQPMR